jgi:hypothetical protein
MELVGGMTSPTSPQSRELEVAVRGWAKADYLAELQRHLPAREGRSSFRDLGPSEWSLVFDTETLTDLSQRLRVGSFQLRRKNTLRKTGLIVDPEALTADELETVSRYADQQGRTVFTRDEFVERIFFPYAYRRRAQVVGFNLPFDLFRLAIDHGPAKGDKSMRGGFSILLSRNPRWPRVQVKRAGPRAAFIRFTVPNGRNPEHRNRKTGGDMQPHRGYFLDVATLAGALFSKRFTLSRLAEHLETPNQKLEVDAHGEQITFDYLKYLDTDVLVTWECFERLRDRYELYGFSTPLYRIFSEASIGKALLTEIGLKPWRETQPDAPDWLVATILETYYGGRSEAVIRKHPVPGVYVDYLSEYPLVFVRLGLWHYLTSTGIEWEHEDPAEAQRFLDTLTPKTLLDPASWTKLHALVEICPDGDRLPTRARYKSTSTTTGPYNVGIALRTGGPAQTYTLLDAAASKLETGTAPRLQSVIRIRPSQNRQTGLRSIDLGGDARYRVDPDTDDLIKRLVELRAVSKKDLAVARSAGDLDAVHRLDAIQLAMKTTANATAYGTPIEMNVIEHRRPVAVTVYLPNGDHFRTRSTRVEQPGKWFHPVVATFVASGGRLLLALLGALVRERGGQHAFGDTDSSFIVATEAGGLVPCPGGPLRVDDGTPAIRALSWRDVEEIVDLMGSLNPYDKTIIPGSILELESENCDPTTGKQRTIECLALATKRYALFARNQHGQPELVGDPEKRRRSEHGLGHLALPTPTGAGTHKALDQWWEHTICTELGLPSAEPSWFEDEALGRLTVTSRHEEAAFRHYNKDRSYGDSVRPWNFLNLAHPTRTERARLGIRCLVSRYESDLTVSRDNAWYDRAPAGQTWSGICTSRFEINNDLALVQSYRDYFNDHRRHVDAKMLDAKGEHCHPWTRGLLQPARITATRIARVGKESNPLSDDNLSHDGLAFEYVQRACRCGAEVVGRRKWCSEACRKRTTRRATCRNGDLRPSSDSRSSIR